MSETHAEKVVRERDEILALWREFFPGSGPTPQEFQTVRASFAFDVRWSRDGRATTKWDRMNNGQRLRAIAKQLKVKPFSK